MNKNEQSPQIRDISIDALVDDIFGVSVRSLKTIGVAFFDPKSYYDAGWTRDWDGRFTPSFRLWFMLVAITFFFQFVWAGAGSPIIEMYGQNMRDNNIVLPPGVAYDTAATTFARVYFSFIPIIVSSMLFLLAVVYRAWGQAMPFVVRARTVFSIVVPSSLMQIFALWPLVAVPQHLLAASALTSSALAIPIDTWVSYRGAFATQAGFGRVWRSLAFALAAFGTMTIGGVLAQAAAVLWVRS